MGNFAKGRLYQGRWKRFCNPGMNCYSCPAASFACPIGAMQAVTGSYKFRFSFYVVGMILAFGVVFGRLICGFLCPFGLIQELFHKIPSPKWKLWKGLEYLKYIILVIFVLVLPLVLTDVIGNGSPAFCQYICPVGTLEGGIVMLFFHEELRSAVGWLFGLKAWILVITLIGCIFFYRFFCKTMCPLGAVYGLLNKISFYRLEVDQNACINCGKCAAACRMNVDPVKNPDSAECIRCGECQEVCPKRAIHLGFGSKISENKAEKA